MSVWRGGLAGGDGEGDGAGIDDAAAGPTEIGGDRCIVMKGVKKGRERGNLVPVPFSALSPFLPSRALPWRTINSPIRSGGYYLDPVGRVGPSGLGQVDNPVSNPPNRAWSWSANPSSDGLQPLNATEKNGNETQNISVKVDGWLLTTGIVDREYSWNTGQDGTVTVNIDKWP